MIWQHIETEKYFEKVNSLAMLNNVLAFVFIEQLIQLVVYKALISGLSILCQFKFRARDYRIFGSILLLIIYVDSNQLFSSTREAQMTVQL